MDLIDNLIAQGWLKTPRIIEAFKKIKRVDFLPEDIKNLAELNEALPIGFGQTISQPLVVAFMIEKLDPRPGEKILDIGSGSGWTTALLAYIVSSQSKSEIRNSKFETEGKIIAIDIIPELVEFGKKNIEKYNFLEKGIVECICADGSKGYSKEAPFDKILVSAAAERCFPAWKEQLKIGGRIVTPIGSSIWVFIKKSEKEVAEAPPHPAEQGAVFEEIEYPGFVFVPLVTGNRKQGTGGRKQLWKIEL